MTTKPRLMILGHARHGKDTVAEKLSAKGYNHVSSSWFVGEKAVWPAYQELCAQDGAPNDFGSFEEFYADRGLMRKFWYEAIAAYNRPDRCRLARELFAEFDMYVGLRNPAEFHAAKIEGLFDLCIWVDASERLPPEPATSNRMEPWMADYILDNNGTLEDLDRGLEVLYNRRIQPLERSDFKGWEE